ncbi:MAG TPA: carboxypeptidase regulatory-like domain-containing protein [Candidatus Limnocylindrales bacterium]|nr:carboxypeptidase regulatory-like domain-containing protein [Candidatus Limnocylindrales bacterium]
MSNHRLAAVLFGLALSVVTLSAQTDFGRISGTVIDASGAAVPNAKVTIRNTDTQATRAILTNNSGFYVAENLPIGPYAVEVEGPGFKRSIRRGFQLVADGRVTADFKLEVGQATQSVDVVASNAETLNTVSGEVADVIDTKQVENVPLNGRNYMELLTLVPGATVTNPDTFSINTSLSATNQVVNGHRSNQNNMTVDGLGNLDAGANGSLINNVSPDFLQEVKIQTSNFSAQYGRSAGVAFNVVTKNGTNTIHGAAFEYFRNDALDARNFFSPNNTELRFNDFGYNIGGPIKHDKLFFFVGEEWKRLRQQSAPSRTTLPTTAELNGDFSALLPKTVIYEPGTKNPFPNNMIPQAMITQEGRAVGNVYRAVMPQAAIFTNTPVANNTTFENPNPLNYREDLARIDYRISAKHTLYGRWVDDYNDIFLADGPGGSIPITPETRDRPGKSLLLSETWIVTPSIVNEVHAGASWNGQRYWNQGDTWLASVEGFTYPHIYDGVGRYPGGIPSGSITSFASWDGPDHALLSPTTEIETADTVSLVRGNHSLRAGVMVIRNRKDQNGRSPYDGSVTFNATGNPNSTGYALADALLGNFNTYTEAAYDPMGRFRYTEPSVFAEDNWKVSRKLTLDLGIRYEYMMAMYSTVNNLVDFVPSLYNPAQAVTVNSKGQLVPGSGNILNGLQRVANGINPSQAYLVPNANSPLVQSVPAGAPRGMYPSQGTFSPRLGFAYGINDKTVIRGGFGLYYDRIQGNPTFYSLNNPPYVETSAYQYSNLSNITGGAQVQAVWGAIQTVNPYLKIPYSEQFSFGIQRQLPINLFAEVDYVGSEGHHLLTEPDINQPTLATLAAASSTSNENYLRPYAGYSQIRQFLSVANSNYNSLQARLSRRAGNVLFTAAYTWSKALGNASGDTENDLNYYNLRAFYGPLSYDATHVFVGSFVWELPRLRNAPHYVSATVGGWQLSGIIHLQTGFPYTVTGNTPILGSRVADYLGGPAVLPNAGPNGWFDPAAFVPAGQSTWGTAGPGDIRGPGLQLYNLSLMKFFNFTERFKLRFGVDFINAFNNVNFQGPSTSISSSNFGTISGAHPARNIQLGAKLIW